MGSTALGVLWTILVGVSCQTSTVVGEDVDDPIVRTSFGPVQGYSFISSWTNQRIYAFQGIPYARPPVGDLRFKDPVFPEPWKSVKNCTKDGASCMQKIDPILKNSSLSFNISEDCLFLNVYKPDSKSAIALPVMVWIHGGGFIEGSGSRFRYGPDFLVAEGVILVTLNYRLGSFGFASLETPEIPGNAGLKDQRLALQWVKSEIINFGGDPAHVTLFGESAGSACVHLHVLSPLSIGLFQLAIGESGTASDWAVRDNSPVYALQLASLLKCSSDTPAHQCLKDASAEDLLTAESQVKPTKEDDENGQWLVFVPSVDNEGIAGSFIPEHPRQMLKHKLGSFVPFVMGTNTDEGMLMFLRGDDYIFNITNNLEYVIPKDVRANCSPERKKLLVQRLRNFYFKNTVTKHDIAKGYVDLFTDQMFGYDTAVSAREFKDRAPVYLYHFTFDGAFKEKFVGYLQQKYNISGVSHAEELSYLFVRQKVNQTAPVDSPEMVTWRRMARMWTNFAKFGSPTVAPDPLLQNVTWKPVGLRTNRYLKIDVNLTMELSDYLGPSVALWDSLTPSCGIAHVQVAGTVALASALVYTGL